MSEKKHRKNDFMQRDEQGRQKAWGERRRHAERRLPASYETAADDFDEDFQPATRGMKPNSDPLGS